MTSVAILLIQDPVKNPALQGTGVTQWVKCPILDLGSGLDLRVVALSTMWGTTLRMEPTLKKRKRKKRKITLNYITIFFLYCGFKTETHG